MDIQPLRGAGQIENDLPEIMRRMRKLLREEGHLANLDNLTKRLFVYHWGSFNTNRNLIETIRNEAVQFVRSRSDFWDLRVEINNFPTLRTLKKVKEYRDNASSDNALDTLDSLIENIERLHGLSSESTNALEDIIQNLPSSDESIILSAV